LATHYHPDHAGLAQELKNLGLKLIVVALQVPAIPILKTHMKPSYNYFEISLKDNLVITLAESRAFLAKLGIQGEIIATPGHSDDSVTLITDEGAAFTGDLTPPLMAGEDNVQIIQASWDAIRARGAKTGYPGHGPSFKLT
jgi:glyoxylase-like metal-dependent hydrolase (beta-lactamase superfamily II)